MDHRTEPLAPLRSVAPWLGVLFVLLFILNAAGGWVRLSGSGVAIPQWPIVDGSLLPPFSEAGWLRVKATFDADQARLARRVEAGELTPANLGRSPKDLDEFKIMFITEWCHRLLSALVGVVALGCMTVAMRHRAVRARIAVPLIAAGGLIVFQAVLGGLIVAHGTGTHFLFLHQANAALIMACMLIAMLRLIDDGTSSAQPPRPGLSTIALITMLATFAELLIGGLVAGSRNGGSFHVYALGDADSLWRHDQAAVWNLLDNAALHQWLHRFTGWALLLLLVALYAVAWRRRATIGPRAGLALLVSATFLPVQLVLGLANVEIGLTPILSLAHQTMGMCLFLSLVLAWRDLRHEALPVANGRPASFVPEISRAIP